MAPKNDPTYFKEYYEKNKQRYKDVYNVTIKCDICNCDVQRLNLSKHKKSKKHILNEESKTNLKDEYSALKTEINHLKEDMNKLLQSKQIHE
jgi:hypothetical protein